MNDSLKPDMICISREELRQIVSEGVKEAFVQVGVNIEDPIEVQKDMSFIRELRTTTASVQKKSLLTLVGILVTGVIAALWLGFKGIMNQ